MQDATAEWMTILVDERAGEPAGAGKGEFVEHPVLFRLLGLLPRRACYSVDVLLRQ
jgi:hypothetical protein